jgi:hypothetical protein
LKKKTLLWVCHGRSRGLIVLKHIKIPSDKHFIEFITFEVMGKQEA